MDYIIQVSFCWLLFLSLYFLTLRKETFFVINRFYLLFSLIIGMLLPYFNGVLFFTHWSETVYGGVLEEVQLTATKTISGLGDAVKNYGAINGEGEVLNMLLVLYWLGVLIGTTKIANGIYRIYTHYRNGNKKDLERYILVENDVAHLPFSFFRWVFVSRSISADIDMVLVMKHEELHIRKWHSLDVLFVEIVQVFFWFNPLIYLYSKALKECHEFEADDHVTSVYSRKEYGEQLLSQYLYQTEFTFTNQFFHSPIKNRLMMMTRQKSNSLFLMKYTLIIPVVILFLIFQSCRDNEVIDGVSDEKAQERTSLLMQDTDATQIIENDKVYKVVEEMPRFSKCDDSYDLKSKQDCSNRKMLEYIYSEMKYPESAKQNNVEGMCVVQFMIDKNGSVQDINVLRSVGGGCDEEAIRVVGSFPRWIPGRQNGQPVNVLFTLPIKFKLA